MLARARTKVLKQGLYPRDMTEPMWHTPRERLYERALRGRWHVFPVSPEPVCERLCNGLGEGFRSRGRHSSSHAGWKPRSSGSIARRRTGPRSDSAPGVRCWPGATGRWCAAIHSYGVIGVLARDALLTYATVPYEPTGIAAQDWCEDLCELLTWEDWASFTATRPGHSPSSAANSPNAPSSSCSRSQRSYARSVSATRQTGRFTAATIE